MGRVVFFLCALALLLGCGESEQAKRTKVAGWVAQLKADPSLADKEEFTKPLGDYADIAAPEFAKLLKEKDKRVQIAALKVLATLKRLAVIDAVATAAESPDPEVRIAAIKTLASFGSPSAIRPLLKRLQDPDPKVRAAALEGLAGPGGREAPPYLREVLPYLAAALGDPDPRIRQAAVNGLVKLGQWSLQALAKVRESGSPIAKQEAEKAFRQICEGFRADLDPKKNTDRLVRRDMARYLGELRYRPAIPDLIRGLEDVDPEVRAACAYALGKLRAKVATARLREVMDNEKEEMPVRVAAAVALGQIGDMAGVRFLIDQLKSSEEKVRSAAVDALRTIGKPAARLLTQAAQSSDPLQRWGALAALGEAGDPRAVPVLLLALRDQNPDVRAVAAAALGKLRYRQAAPQLVRALGDPNERVQAHAEWALENIGQDAIPALLDGAKRPALRWRIFRLLGRLKSPQAVPVLIDGLRDRNLKVRAMAAWALGEIGSRRAVAALRSALNGPDPQVRREAALALGKLKAKEVRLELAERLKTDRSEQVRVAAQMALQQLSQ
jgi:HEAT repeat protein